MTSKLIETENFITLMHELISSNSPAVKLNSLYEFLLQEPNFLSSEERNDLIAQYKEAKETKAISGRTDSQKRWNKKNKTDVTLWLFIAKSRYMSKCEGCQEKYYIGDPVFVNEKKGYHIQCTPIAIASTHPIYQKYLEGKVQ